MQQRTVAFLLRKALIALSILVGVGNALSIGVNFSQEKVGSQFRNEMDEASDTDLVFPESDSIEVFFPAQEHVPVDDQDFHQQQILEVSESSPYCQFNDGVLTCDFHWSPQDVVVPAIPKASGPIDEVFVQKAHHLKLDGNLCSKIVLHHITNVLTMGDPQNRLCRKAVVSLLNVTLSHLPMSVTSFHASNANIASLILGESTQDVFVTNSNIQLFSISSKNNKIQVKLQDTYIARVENLQIMGDSNILCNNCSIGDLPHKAIVIGTTGNVLDKITLPKEGGMTKEGLSLTGGSDVFIGELSGSVHIQSQLCDSHLPSSDKDDSSLSIKHIYGYFGRHNPHSPCLMRPEDCPYNISHLLLIILIFSLFLNATQILFNQPRKFIYGIIQRTVKPPLDLNRPKEDETVKIELVQQEAGYSKVPTLVHKVSISDPFSIEELRKIECDQSAVPLISTEQFDEDRLLQPSQQIINQEDTKARHRKCSLHEHNFWSGANRPNLHPTVKRSSTTGNLNFQDYTQRANPFQRTSASNHREEYPLVEKSRNSLMRKHSYTGPYESTREDFWFGVQNDFGKINDGFTKE